MSLSLVLAIPFPVAAQEKPVYPDFTFRRVSVPQPGSVGMIDVQIDPATQFDVLVPISLPRTDEKENPPVAEAETPDIADAADPYDWYWKLVPPGISAKVDKGGRLELAVNSLTQNPNHGVPTPRLQEMQEIAERFGSEILLASIGTSVSPALALAVIGVESSGRVDAISSAGASGLMQLIPATAERFGVADTTDPAENIRGGIAYLDWLMGEFDNDPILVLAAYNAGENAVRKNNGVPDYAETRGYVPKVLAAWTVARGLCQTQPELISDGCVFAVREARNDG